MVTYTGMILPILLALLVNHSQQNSNNGCEQQGLMAHPNDCTKYQVCVSDSQGEFIAYEHNCNFGEAFDSTAMTCLPIEEVPNCNPSEDMMISAMDDPVTNCNNKSVSCLSCSQVVTCLQNGNGTYSYLGTTNCSPNTYCDEGTNLATCISTIPARCVAEQKCSGTGYFPVIGNCYKFQYCADAPSGTNSSSLLVSTILDCGVGEVSTGHGCLPVSAANTCRNLTCTGTGLGYVAYAGDSSYYALCNNGLALYVFRCPNGYNFNVNTRNCEVLCKTAGNQPDPKNCKRYYYCATATNSFTGVLRNCTTSTSFDTVRQTCLPVAVNYPGCQ